MTKIGFQAFSGCTGLSDVYCYAIDVPKGGDSIFYGLDLSSATLYVPAASLETYKATAPWSSFGKFVPLTDEEMGVEELTIDNGQLTMSAGIYDLNGRRLTKMQRGLNIVRYADGTTRKVMIK